MSVQVLPCGAVAIALPRPGEFVLVERSDRQFHVNGFNFDRGFGWHVGDFSSYRRAMIAARAHKRSEIEIAEGMA